MPPPAADPDADEDLPEDGTARVSLDDASARLESALARLEALVEAGPLQSDLFRPRSPDDGDDELASSADSEALRAELGAARDRERALEAAATAASAVLGRAVAEFRHALDASARAEAFDENDAALDPAPATAEEARS